MPTKNKSKTSNKMPNFEQSLKELETLVGAMESGDLTLQESMAYFERGIELTRSCQQSLTNAEQKIKMLMKTAKQEKLVDFDAD